MNFAGKPLKLTEPTFRFEDKVQWLIEYLSLEDPSQWHATMADEHFCKAVSIRPLEEKPINVYAILLLHPVEVSKTFAKTRRVWREGARDDAHSKLFHLFFDSSLFTGDPEDLTNKVLGYLESIGAMPPKDFVMDCERDTHADIQC